jgi:hypothetical protein
METISPNIKAPLRRRLFSWRALRWLLVTLAVFATLVAAFYTVENVRGKRAWEKVRREMEARGANYDWTSLIPPPVPDEQNIFKVPIMARCFVGRGTNDLSARLNQGKRWGVSSEVHVPLAELTAAADVNAAAGDTVWPLEDSFSRPRVHELLDRLVGTNAIGCQGILLVNRPNAMTPARIVLQTRETPTVAQLQTNVGSSMLNLLQITNPSRGVFQISIHPPLPAAEYLAWSDSFEKDFDLIREALKRTYAQFVCDYSQPALIDIPNFVTSRDVVQTLAQRAQCHLMLGQPDQALRDLTLIHDLCRIFQGAPTGKPMTLVSSMINVAVAGLYAETLADSFRFHAWNDSQLRALQQQCSEIHLAVPLAESMRDEQVFSFHTIETYSRAELVKMFDQIGIKPSLRRLLKYAPKGWLYQGMAIHGPLSGQFLDGFDVVARTVSPRKIDEAARAVSEQTEHVTAYNFIGVLAVPNYVRALQVFARNQTAANEGAVACALERYRLARGEYPETLTALTPEFIATLPHDMVGGQPLKYRRTNDGQFVLYSIGWNERDDGGVPGKSIPEGDWVWEQRN